MSARVAYKSSVGKDLKRLDRKTAFRILDEIDGKLGKDSSAGAPLTGEFKGMFRLRIGGYRVIYSKSKGGVLILRIAHRKDAYR